MPPFPLSSSNLLTLAIDIYSNNMINGLEQKYFSLCCDIILFISKPAISLTGVLACIKKLGNISGYELNIIKSELFPVNIDVSNLPPSVAAFKLALDDFFF